MDGDAFGEPPPEPHVDASVPNPAESAPAADASRHGRAGAQKRQSRAGNGQ
jgi:hypothetical protein